MKKIYVFYFFTVLILIVSCHSSSDDTPSAIDTFHKDYYSINIYPTLIAFKIDIEKQIALTKTLKGDTSIENFNKIQNQWLTSAKSFSRTRAYNLVAVKAKFYDILIYNFPVSTSIIENNIAKQTIYDTAYFTSESTVSKGLGTLEYLLFNEQNTDMALQLLKDDTYRIDYLLGVSEDILAQTNALIDFWESGYKDTFINSTDLSCTSNARCLAFNQLINILDIIRVTKLGKPSGLENSGVIATNSLEAYRSESSLELMKSTIEEVQHAYALSTVNFSSIVDDIANSTEISNVIDSGFSDVYNDINAINSSLYEAIENDDPNVEAFYNSLFNLVKYLSVDAASILSVAVLPTDNDGD